MALGRAGSATAQHPARGAVGHTGLMWACGTAVTSGVAIWVNRFGVEAWSDSGGSLPYTAAKNTVAAVLLAVLVIAFRGEPIDPRRLRAHWRGLAAVAVFGGAVPFAMFFEGLARATSTQAAFLHKTLLIWVALLAVPLLRERIKPIHMAAMTALVGGQVMLAGGMPAIGFGSGEYLILGATLLWAVEVIVAKRLLAAVPPATLGAVRIGGGAVILVAWAVTSLTEASMEALGSEQLRWVALTGTILAGYVYTWMNALALARAIDVTAVLVGSVLVTALLDSWPVGELMLEPGMIVIMVGVALVMVAWRRDAVRV